MKYTKFEMTNIMFLLKIEILKIKCTIVVITEHKFIKKISLQNYWVYVYFAHFSGFVA
jgi:hypothetical protein